jgi:predicted oxidoreductase
MERTYLSPKGPELSRIVSGAWRWNAVSQDVVEKLIHTSLEQGITSFDHADIYGDYSNEKIFGDAIKGNSSLRRSMQLVTKCGIMLMSSKQPGTRIKHYDTSKKHIIGSVENSLKLLGTDYLDLLLIHRPDPLMNAEEVSEAFGLLKQNGKVLSFGVSNFTSAQFEMLQSYLPFPLVTNQVEVSLGKLDALYDGTLDTMMKFKASPMAWSPLGGGKLVSGSELGNSIGHLKEKYSASEAQLYLAWLLKHPSKMVPVIGTTKPERIAEAAAAIEIILDRQDWFEMLKLASGKDVA